MSMQLYVKELAALVRLTDRRLYQINAELPEEKKLIVRKEGEKKADLALFVQRWTDYKLSLEREADGLTLEEAKTRHEIIKTEKTKYELKRLTGEYVPAADVTALGQEIVSGAKNNLLHIPATMGPVLAHVDDPEEIELILSRAIREALEDLSRMENYEPDIKDPGESEDEEEEEDREWENE